MEKKVQKIIINTVHHNQEGEWTYQSLVQELDINGNILKSTQYAHNGDIIESLECEYDKNNNLVFEKKVLGEFETEEKTRYNWNSDGKLDSILTEYSDGGITKQVYNHDSDKTTIRILDEKDDLEGEQERTFDGNGNVLSEIIRNSNLTVDEHSTFEYEGNNLIMKKAFNKSNVLDHYTQLKYFSTGALKSEITYSAKGNVINSIVNEIDDNGNITSATHAGGMQVENAFDTDNQIIEQRIVNTNNGLTEQLKQYHYEKGFLTQETIYEMGEEYWLQPETQGRLPSQKTVLRYTYSFH